MTSTHSAQVPVPVPSEPLRTLRSVAKTVTKQARLAEQRLTSLQPADEVRLRTISAAKIATGFAALAAGGVVQGSILLALLPSRPSRIRACNYFGKVMGRLFVRLSGAPLTIEGEKHLDRNRPAIYASNHTSIVDIFLAIWLSPVGTVGVAKKEVVLYPIFGQLYLLSGHLMIDRGRSSRAISSMRKLGKYVRKHKLSIFLWPEGTRSRSGRLLPFKKGVVHLAIQTGLPVVPIVVRGTHKSWSKGSLTVNPAPILVRVLPPVSTEHWTETNIEQALDELRARFIENLPGRSASNRRGAYSRRLETGQNSHASGSLTGRSHLTRSPGPARSASHPAPLRSRGRRELDATTAPAAWSHSHSNARERP